MAINYDLAHNKGTKNPLYTIKSIHNLADISVWTSLAGLAVILARPSCSQYIVSFGILKCTNSWSN
jgi:hypothetical protein